MWIIERSNLLAGKHNFESIKVGHFGTLCTNSISLCPRGCFPFLHNFAFFKRFFQSFKSGSSRNLHFEFSERKHSEGNNLSSNTRYRRGTINISLEMIKSIMKFFFFEIMLIWKIVVCNQSLHFSCFNTIKEWVQKKNWRNKRPTKIQTLVWSTTSIITHNFP